MKRKELWVLVLVYFFIVAAGHWAGLLRDFGGKWMNRPISLENLSGHLGRKYFSWPLGKNPDKSRASVQTSTDFFSNRKHGFHPAKFGVKASVSNS